MKLLILLLISSVCFSQDSVSLKITKIRTADGKNYIWFKDVKSGARYVSVCECKLPDSYKKGSVVKVKEVEVIRESLRKGDLEN